MLLAVAVTLFRTFAAEGYLISTGSMAPTLLGYHRRVTCPDCQHLFARGAAFDRDVQPPGETALADFDDPGIEQSFSHCPNCGRSQIASWQVPRNEGDQLLVHKHAYELRDPRRWEVIVFRNPADPRQAYVKRVAGLPGERFSIEHGEVSANGQLCRKPYEVQQAMRILVSDATRLSQENDADWRPRWTPEENSNWISSAAGFTVESSNDGQTHWLNYRHWIRTGGHHETTVPLSAWPDEVEQPNPSFENIVYAYPTLIGTGVFTDVDRKRWKMRSDDPDYQMALDQLFEQSHVAPVTDECGYNAPTSADGYPVNDFMVSFRLSNVEGEGGLAVHLNGGSHQFLAILDFRERKIDLIQDQNPQPVATAPLPEASEDSSWDVDFSCFDSQIILAINGIPVWEPVLFTRDGAPIPLREPTRLGAVDLSCRIENLRLYRDVYYTPKPNPGKASFELSNDAFFVLGDNSPVSVDSRVWDDPEVPRDALIGKPLVVHLPSKQAQVSWNGAKRFFRIPDFGRVRFVK
ncbi:MAG: signal peptidase I [Planctomycetaceae bacterium]|nr:signal peptidase I [Planctomycetaceae bacterium]